MKNILHIILISFFCLTFISCAKESGSSSSSTTGLMLEGGIFAGMKKDDTTFWGSINLPLDSYEGDFQWDLLGYPLTYKATVKKNLSIFLIFKTKIWLFKFAIKSFWYGVQDEKVYTYNSNVTF